MNSTWKIKALHALTGDVTCWNCGKPGHNLWSCPEPRNRDCIDKARTAFRENKKSDANKQSGSKGGGNGYLRGKFGKPPACGETVRFAKKESGKKGSAQPKPKSKSKKSESDADPGGGLTLASLGEHFAKMETSASDPTQANMAQLLKNLFQGKV